MKIRVVRWTVLATVILASTTGPRPASATNTLVASYGSPYRVQYNYNSSGILSCIEVEFLTAGRKPTIYTCRRPQLGPCVNEIRLGEVGCYEFVGALSRHCDSSDGSVLCGSVTVTSIRYLGEAYCE